MKVGPATATKVIVEQRLRQASQLSPIFSPTTKAVAGSKPSTCASAVSRGGMLDRQPAALLCLFLESATVWSRVLLPELPARSHRLSGLW